MFKVKRRLTKSLRKGNSSTRSLNSAQRSYNDGGSDNSSIIGGGEGGGDCGGEPSVASTSTFSTPPRPKPIIKTSKTKHNATDGDARFSGSATDTTKSTEGYGDASQPQLKLLRFGEVHIREFERILGDNPSCSSGAPIGYVSLQKYVFHSLPIIFLHYSQPFFP